MVKTKQKTPLNLSKNAITVLNKRYLKRDTDGTPTETVADMFRRVAQTINGAEPASNSNKNDYEEDYYSSMTNLDFLPNSPTLMNAGREIGQLSACFVLPIEDSMESIFEAIKNTWKVFLKRSKILR